MMRLNAMHEKSKHSNKIQMRNPLTKRLRKKTRHSTTRKSRSTFFSTPLESLVNKRFLKSIHFFTIVTQLLVFHSIRLLHTNNRGLTFSMLRRSRIALHVTCFFNKIRVIGWRNECGFG